MHVALWLTLTGCAGPGDTAVFPLLPSEEEFAASQAALACRWADECGILDRPRKECTKDFLKGLQPDQQWKLVCNGRYDAAEAGRCLTLWRDTPIDCGVRFYSICSPLDVYDVDDVCR